MDRETFADRFRRAARRARDCAQFFIEEEPPSELRFRLELNASFDGNPLHETPRDYSATDSQNASTDALLVISAPIGAAWPPPPLHGRACSSFGSASRNDW